MPASRLASSTLVPRNTSIKAAVGVDDANEIHGAAARDGAASAPAGPERQPDEQPGQRVDDARRARAACGAGSRIAAKARSVQPGSAAQRRDLAAGLDHAEQRQHRHQHRDDQRQRLDALVPRPHPQPEMQPDHRVAPRDDEHEHLLIRQPAATRRNRAREDGCSSRHRCRRSVSAIRVPTTCRTSNSGIAKPSDQLRQLRRRAAARCGAATRPTAPACNARRSRRRAAPAPDIASTAQTPSSAPAPSPSSETSPTAWLSRCIVT